VSKHKLNIRFAHYDKVTAIKKIKSNYIGTGEHMARSLNQHTLTAQMWCVSRAGKFTCVRGTIVRVGNIKPIVRQMDFHCGRCGSTMTRIFEDGKFSAPEKCATTHCRGRAFDPVRGSAVTVDWQKIR
jgi:DNA helicase MCM8